MDASTNLGMSQTASKAFVVFPNFALILPKIPRFLSVMLFDLRVAEL